MTQIYVLGEALLEFFASAPDTGLAGVAGDTFNTAVGLAQCGLSVEYISGLGTDEASAEILETCRNWSVGFALSARIPGRGPGRYTIHLDDLGERSFSYDRDQSAARQLFSDPVLLQEKLDAIAPGQWIYLSGISLAIASQECRELLAGFLRDYRANGALPGRVAFDCNHRPSCGTQPKRHKPRTGCYWITATSFLPARKTWWTRAWQIPGAWERSSMG